LCSFLSSGSIQARILGNLISDKGAMTFFWWRAQSALVLSSDLTHLHHFSRFSRPELQNPNFLVPLRSLLSSGSIQVKKLENPISDEGAMSFFWWRAQSALVLVGRFL
jgi:hypothetical protein